MLFEQGSQLHAPKLSGLNHRGYAEGTASLERGGFKIEPQFARPAPGFVELHVRRLTSDLRILVAVLGAFRVAEIVWAELGHHVQWRPWYTLGDPFQYRICAALYMVGHHKVSNGQVLAPVGDERKIARHRLPVPRCLGQRHRAATRPELEVR